MTFKMPPSFAIVSSLLGHIGTFAAVGFEVRKGDALYSEAQLCDAYNAGLEDAAEAVEAGHTWITSAAASALIRKLKEKP